MYGLQRPDQQGLPKCLLRFGGKSLLERHFLLLREVGVTQIVLALGFRHDLVQSELDSLQWTPRPTVVLNHRFELGSVLTVHTGGGAGDDAWRGYFADGCGRAVRPAHHECPGRLLARRLIELLIDQRFRGR